MNNPLSSSVRHIGQEVSKNSFGPPFGCVAALFPFSLLKLGADTNSLLSSLSRKDAQQLLSQRSVCGFLIPHAPFRLQEGRRNERGEEGRGEEERGGEG